MTPTTEHTPYSRFLGDREPIAAIRETADRIRDLTAAWTADRYERTYAPGKWPARTILLHLAQTEIAFGYRVRMALTTPSFVVQPFDQDKWIAREPPADGPTARAAFLAANALNLALFASLSPADRATSMTHPEYGAISVNWVIHQTAGHLINHLGQVERI